MLFLVHDTKQTLYTWRNANYKIAEHLSRVLSADVLTRELRVAYRSPRQIVDTANQFSEGFNRFNVEVSPSDSINEVTRGSVFCDVFETPKDEALWLLRNVQEIAEEGAPWKEITILARANRTLFDLEKAFIGRGIPYQVKYDSRSFLNKSPFKAIYAMYSLVLNPRDVSALLLLLEQVVGVGSGFLEYMARVSSSSAHDQVSDLLKSLDSKWKRQVKIASGWLDDVLSVAKWVESARGDITDFHRRLYQRVQEKFSGEDQSVYGALAFDRSIFWETVTALTEVSETAGCGKSDGSVLDSVTRTYDSLQLSVDAYKTRGKDSGRERDAVLLTTVHGFKGRESDYVFFVCALPPQGMRIDDFQDWCIWYVAITRARKRLYVSGSRMVSFGGLKGPLRQTPENPLFNRFVKSIS